MHSSILPLCQSLPLEEAPLPSWSFYPGPFILPPILTYAPRFTSAFQQRYAVIELAALERSIFRHSSCEHSAQHRRVCPGHLLPSLQDGMLIELAVHLVLTYPQITFPHQGTIVTDTRLLALLLPRLLQRSSPTKPLAARALPRNTRWQHCNRRGTCYPADT